MPLAKMQFFKSTVGLLAAAWTVAAADTTNVVKKDVIVIGGGASGAHAAVRLRDDYGFSVALIEKDEILVRPRRNLHLVRLAKLIYRVVMSAPTLTPKPANPITMVSRASLRPAMLLVSLVVSVLKLFQILVSLLSLNTSTSRLPNHTTTLVQRLMSRRLQ